MPGPTLILLNKHILKDLNFNFPMFLSCLGLISASTVAHVAVRVFGVELPNQARMTRDMYLKNVVPVGVCQAATLALGNAAYLHLTVSFIQMLKAFTPTMVLVVGVLFAVEYPERKVGSLFSCIPSQKQRQQQAVAAYTHSTHPFFIHSLDCPGRPGHLLRHGLGLLRRGQF